MDRHGWISVSKGLVLLLLGLLLSDWATHRVTPIQAQGLPLRIALRQVSTGKFVSAWDGDHALIANRDAEAIGEEFDVVCVQGCEALTPRPTPVTIPVPVPVPIPHEAVEAFDLRTAVLTGGATVSGWPITTELTTVDLQPGGFALSFSKKSGPGRWPDVIPLGWTGPVQYTLWLGAKANGQWHLAASLLYWQGLDVSGGPVIDARQYAENLWYLDPVLKAHAPAIGESIAVLVTAGGQRGLNAPSISERSNVVTIPFPGHAQTFQW